MPKKILAKNKKARHQYEIIDEYEAGLVLVGTEVKSLRSGKVTINNAFAKVKEDEIYIHNMHIPEYDKGNINNHEPTRIRKLLLKKREMQKIIDAVQQKGVSFVPLDIYFSSRGIAKMRMAVVRGKKLYDKRESLKRNMQEREIARAEKYRRR